MKVAFITRSTLYSVPGGDTVQVVQTAGHLAAIGVDVEIKLANEAIPYADFDLLHFFNITRPADILSHSARAKKPFVVSTIMCDYSEYDKYHTKGLRALLGKLPAGSIEYFKTIARWFLGKDKLASMAYLWLGQHNSIKKILREAALVLPNSLSEYRRIVGTYAYRSEYKVVTNGINTSLFNISGQPVRNHELVICVARIEGIKNQLNLIKALNNTRFTLLLIGSAAPNQQSYYEECRAIAARNVQFINHIPQQELLSFYRLAKVHVLPSWFETTGLSSIEAAAMGCNIVITDKGDTREYFEDDAFYCDPARPDSILAAIERASEAEYNQNLQKRIEQKFTWQRAALQTYQAYQLAYSA
ncbi:glycosyltransferase family 4 protein [Mucilaginibacter pedocola]|uniref:Glycosyl transferase family 1 domain-containing protein n=1 Tax=Mucilaginibacter pedocola TaxID=1792845 RepID=A0A1S9P9M0_9SPHI|nr:glycosyltransferase family 4 protein [Mucilaginibacter pedocola]OOQ57278.1 hypothetical protein BC343_14270 [Mucilaginibacter pedocola]